MHVVTRDDLVGQFIGHTAPKTKEAIARAAGGVLFIDEAYYLFRPEDERDYGQEVIEILLTEMEKDRVAVGIAGPKPMPGAIDWGLREYERSASALVRRQKERWFHIHDLDAFDEFMAGF